MRFDWASRIIFCVTVYIILKYVSHVMCYELYVIRYCITCFTWVFDHNITNYNFNTTLDSFDENKHWIAPWQDMVETFKVCLFWKYSQSPTWIVYMTCYMLFIMHSHLPDPRCSRCLVFRTRREVMVQVALCNRLVFTRLKTCELLYVMYVCR